MSQDRPRTVFVGAGKLTRALLPLLLDAGYPVQAVASRSPASARRATRGRRGIKGTADLGVALAEAPRLLLLAVPDRTIRPLAEELAARAQFRGPGTTVLHFAGSLGPAVLGPLAEAGAGVGVLHPLQCLGDERLARELLPGSHARVEGRGRARTVARRLARDLGMRPFELPGSLSPARRARYHAAAAIVSNDLLALLTVGTRLLESLGLEPDAAQRALLPLARGTLRQVQRGGVAAALTGPVVRGDDRTLAEHLRRLPPGTREIHRLLSRRLLRLASDEGRELPAAERRRIVELLGGRWQGSGV